MAKIRVSELAKQYGMTSKEMLARLKKMGIPAKIPSSALEGAYVAIARKKLSAPVKEEVTRETAEPKRAITQVAAKADGDAEAVVPQAHRAEVKDRARTDDQEDSGQVDETRPACQPGDKTRYERIQLIDCGSEKREEQVNKMRKTQVGLMNSFLGNCQKTVSEAIDKGDIAPFRDLRFWKHADSDGEPHIPDYQCPETVAYYHLRYFRAYAFEYYCIYRIVLALSGIGEPKVASIGCGDGIDRFALRLALLDGREEKYLLDRLAGNKWEGNRDRWLGIDLAGNAWGAPTGNQPENFPSHGNAVDWLKGGAVEYFKEFKEDAKKRNVFFFPRSLCELSDEVACELAEAIGDTKFESNRIAICISNRAQQGDEYKNSRLVVEAFRGAGFIVATQALGDGQVIEFKNDVVGYLRAVGGNDELTTWSVAAEEDGPIRALDDSFCPRFYRQFLQKWQKQMVKMVGICLGEEQEDWECPNAQDCVDAEPKRTEGGGDGWKCPLAMYPVSTTSQMNFQIVFLERKSSS